MSVSCSFTGLLSNQSVIIACFGRGSGRGANFIIIRVQCIPVVAIAPPQGGFESSFELVVGSCVFELVVVSVNGGACYSVEYVEGVSCSPFGVETVIFGLGVGCGGHDLERYAFGLRCLRFCNFLITVGEGECGCADCTQGKNLSFHCVCEFKIRNQARGLRLPTD